MLVTVASDRDRDDRRLRTARGHAACIVDGHWRPRGAVNQLPVLRTAIVRDRHRVRERRHLPR